MNDAPTTTPVCTTWQGCYDDGWQEMIVDEAYTHPAKFSYGLINRIYRHCLDKGYVRPGDIVGDPFGGVGCGGIIAAYLNIRWVSIELEAGFVDLAKQNFALHAGKWKVGGMPMPVILQGDSREFAKLIGACEMICTSPPYAEGLGERYFYDAQYSHNRRGGAIYPRTYGQSDGQIGALKAGKVDGIVTSPPWEDQEPSHCSSDKPYNKKLAEAGVFTSSVVDSEYGQSDGQIGNTKSETYWEACAQVYRQCTLALKNDGIMCVVIKDYISGGKRVPLCDQTLALLESLGFTPLERIRAMLVKEDRHPGLFGEDVVETTERKSFFRRLAEKKGSPRIDWEEVLIVKNTFGQQG